MLDCHCHLDRFKNPLAVAQEAASRDVFIIAVTSLPSHFQLGLPHARRLPKVRLALGMHPLIAAEHEREREIFCKSISQSSFIGEVGLDFSREGKNTKDAQIASFRLVAEQIAGKPKFVSLHSRGAEAAVLDVLTEFQIKHAVFHWYSGPLGVLDEAIRRGHFFSINPAMTRAQSGRKIIERIPADRILTETDGPHVQCCSEPANPWHVECVEQFLANEWACTHEEARSRVWHTFTEQLRAIGLTGTSE